MHVSEISIINNDGFSKYQFILFQLRSISQQSCWKTKNIYDDNNRIFVWRTHVWETSEPSFRRNISSLVCWRSKIVRGANKSSSASFTLLCGRTKQQIYFFWMEWMRCQVWNDSNNNHLKRIEDFKISWWLKNYLQ